jgi:ABC-type phosphate/phosphonate transport system permease subunit
MIRKSVDVLYHIPIKIDQVSAHQPLLLLPFDEFFQGMFHCDFRFAVHYQLLLGCLSFSSVIQISFVLQFHFPREVELLHQSMYLKMLASLLSTISAFLLVLFVPTF